MTEAQQINLFTEWALYGPTEQRLMIEESSCYRGKLLQGWVS